MATLTEREAVRSFKIQGDLNESAHELVRAALDKMTIERLTLGYMYLDAAELEKPDWEGDSWKPHGPSVRFGESRSDDE